MIKSLAACAFVSTLVFAMPASEAQAKVNLDIGVGINLGGPGYYGEPGYYYEPAPVYYSGCGHAREMVRAHGFRKVKPVDCSAPGYAFKAKRHGDWWLVRTNTRGYIRSVQPL